MEAVGAKAPGREGGGRGPESATTKRGGAGAPPSRPRREDGRARYRQARRTLRTVGASPLAHQAGDSSIGFVLANYWQSARRRPVQSGSLGRPCTFVVRPAGTIMPIRDETSTGTRYSRSTWRMSLSPHASRCTMKFHKAVLASWTRAARDSSDGDPSVPALATSNSRSAARAVSNARPRRPSADALSWANSCSSRPTPVGSHGRFVMG